MTTMCTQYTRNDTVKMCFTDGTGVDVCTEIRQKLAYRVVKCFPNEGRTERFPSQTLTIRRRRIVVGQSVDKNHVPVRRNPGNVHVEHDGPGRTQNVRYRVKAPKFHPYRTQRIVSIDKSHR